MTHKQFWLGVAQYYRQQLNDFTLQMYADDVAHIPIETLQVHFLHYRRDQKNRMMPLPSFFLTQQNPELSVDAQAEQVTRLIQEAIVKFGWPSPELARQHIGEVGWRVVQMRGGWQSVCENLGVEWDVGTFHAQARQSAKSLIESAKLGFENSSIGLPSPDERLGLQSPSDVLQKLGLQSPKESLNQLSIVPKQIPKGE